MVSDRQDSPDLARAMDYPYDVREAGYCLDFGHAPVLFCPDLSIRLLEARPGRIRDTVRFYDFVLELDGRREEWPDRAAFLASGSNAAPAQLQRKFTGKSSTALLTLPLWIRDHIPVFSAHFSHYASITATLAPWEGAESRLFVNLLDPRQADVMHATEGNYDIAVLDQRCARGEDGGIPEFSIHYYDSHSGVLQVNDAGPCLCGPFAVRPEKFQRLSERELLELARRRFMPEASLEDFLCSLLASPAKRLACEATLRREGVRA